MKTQDIKAILVTELEKYEAKVGESKKVIPLCSNHHIKLMKETWPRHMFNGKPIYTDRRNTDCIVCSASVINLVKKEEVDETNSVTN